MTAQTAQEDTDKGFIVDLLEEHLSGDERRVTIDGFEGALSSQATLDQLTVADSEGVWLTLSDVALDWNRGALLRGQVDVSSLSAAEIILARPPLPGNALPSAEAEPFSLPELPVGISLGALTVQRLELGADFVGQPLTLEIAGSAMLGGGEADFDLKASRLDQTAGVFDLSGGFENETRRLIIDLKLEEDPDGIIANLIGLQGAPSVAMTLAGDAPLDDFAADLTIATEGIDRIAGSFKLTETDGSQDFSVDVNGDVTTLFAPDYRDFFGPDIALKASGRAPAVGGFDLDEFNIQAAALELSGQANIGADGFPERFDLSGRLASDDDLVLLPISGPKTFVQSADVSLAFDAAVSEEWTLAFAAKGFDRLGLLIEDLELSGNGIIRAETGEISANIDYEADGLVIDDANLADALGQNISGDLRLVASDSAPTELESFTLSSESLDLDAQATLIAKETGFDISSTALATISDLSKFSGLSGVALDGLGQATLISNIDPLNGLFDVLLTAQTDDLALGIEQLDPLLAGSATLSFDGVRDESGTRLNALRLKSDEVLILSNAALTNDGGSGEFSVTLNDIGKVEPSLSGTAQLDGEATLRADQSIDFDLTLQTAEDEVALGGTSTPTPAGRTLIAETAFDLSEIARFAELANRDIAGRLAGEGNFVLLADQTRFTTDLSLNTNDIRTGIAQIDPLLAGDGTWLMDGARTGESRFKLNALRGETPGLSIDANGQGDLEGALSGKIDVKLPSAQLIAPGLPGSLSLIGEIERGEDLISEVSLDLDGQGTDFTFEGTVAAPEDDYAAAGIINIAVDSLAPFSELAGRPLAGAIEGTFTGSITPDLDTVDLQIDAQSRGLSVGIDAADKLLQGNGSYIGSVFKDGDQIEVSNLDISTASIVATGDLSAKGPTGLGTFNARLNDIGLFTDQLSGPVTASGEAARTSGVWRLDINANGPGGILANANGTVTDDLNLNVAVDGAAPLGLANDLLEPRRISGTANFDLLVNGPPALSSVSGVVTSRGARLAVPTFVEALEDINADITIQNGTASLSVDAEFQTGGEVQLSGPLTLSAPFNANLNATLRSLILLDPELYETRVSGNFGVNGPLTGGAAITGNVEVFNTEIRVPSSGIGALGNLPEVSHFGAPANVQQTITRAGATLSGQDIETASSSGPAFPIDITVNAPSRIFVRGRGLDAELGGALTLTGTTDNIIPNGQFNLVRGRLDILQQRFELSEGSASLQGDFEPYIRLVARTEASTGTAIQIIVEGPATSPEVSFVSSPELPQDEVLSQLIFGRNLSDISPFQAVQLAAAIGTLAGRGGTGIIDNFRENLNLDDFDVTTDDEGNAAVRAGAYLSENVYTDVTVSSDGSTEINLNLDITDEVTARGTVDDDGETSVGIFFQRDY